MKNYELTCLISPNLSEVELKSFQEKIIVLLQKEQGILVGQNQDKVLKKNLYFSVKKMVQAYLINFNFKINPEGLQNLKKALKIEPELIRYIILVKKLTKIIKMPEKPVRVPKKISQPKVELKEIEKKLEEILGE
ncbi:30S ribosomal protein S6 [Patescibacteria group bacterium]|nr:30S ribosomal protein S6 [Patescibacteria group bacterium]